MIHGLKIESPTNVTEARVSLFADDVAVYLSEQDNIKTLFDLLDRWCLASGVRFNKDKTIIIPVGHEGYRQRTLSTQSLSPTTHQPIPDSTRILKDGEATRYLGAEIGNKPTGNDPWPKITESIKNSLKTWEKAC